MEERLQPLPPSLIVNLLWLNSIIGLWVRERDATLPTSLDNTVWEVNRLSQPHRTSNEALNLPRCSAINLLRCLTLTHCPEQLTVVVIADMAQVVRHLLNAVVAETLLRFTTFHRFIRINNLLVWHTPECRAYLLLIVNKLYITRRCSTHCRYTFRYFAFSRTSTTFSITFTILFFVFLVLIVKN